MSATNWAMAVSLTVIFFSFGIIIFNELNVALIQSEVGRPLAVYNTSAFLGYEDLEGLQPENFNATMTEVGNFQKPEDVDFNFDFWKSISIFRIIINMIWTPIAGFAYFLNSALYMPDMLVLPVIIMVNLANFLFGIYVFLGKEF
jgi:hypothetical protein